MRIRYVIQELCTIECVATVKHGAHPGNPNFFGQNDAVLGLHIALHMQ